MQKAIILFFIMLMGCGGDDSPLPARIGQACSATSACASGEMCLADQPGGLCVKACTESGSSRECGAGSICDTVNVTAADGGVVDMVLCLADCQHDEDCRAGYSCNGVSSGTGKVCRPL